MNSGCRCCTTSTGTGSPERPDSTQASALGPPVDAAIATTGCHSERDTWSVLGGALSRPRMWRITWTVLSLRTISRSSLPGSGVQCDGTGIASRAPATRASTTGGELWSARRADRTRIGVGVRSMICAIAAWPSSIRLRSSTTMSGRVIATARSCPRGDRLADERDVTVEFEHLRELPHLVEPGRGDDCADRLAARVHRRSPSSRCTASSRLPSSNPLLTM